MPGGVRRNAAGPNGGWGMPKLRVRSLISRFTLAAAAVSLLLSPATLAEENLSDADKLLCAPIKGSECRRDGCSTSPAWDMNIPQFVEIDLDHKLIKTTNASDENLETKIDSIKRDDDLIVLQGYEDGRAFSMVITESSGFATMGVTVDDGGVVVFASCTRKY